ncbi:78 kDa glucose-regulated protein [Pyronema omphalodes]|nr:78 kDa glucose-regulated protein [Pyronema omphalodes]
MPRRRPSSRAPSFSRNTLTWALIIFCVFCPLLFAVTVRAEDTNTTSGDEVHSEYGTVIGIDLGTTYSCASVYRNGRAEIIPNQQGDRTTPSYVAFPPDGARLVGAAAKNQAALNPASTIFDIKRVLGRQFKDPSLQADIKHFPFTLKSRAGKPVLKINDETFTPEQISSQVLADLKASAEAYLGEKVTHAVITVPAYFNDAQRQATKDAGTLAGLTVLRLVNEPTAAAMAYGIDQPNKDAGTVKRVIVYDLGGGTFDVSLLEIDEGIFEVIATGGDTHLGGEDFDNRVIEHFTKQWNIKHPNSDVKTDKKAMSKLKREVEKAKMVLSSEKTAKIEIDAFFGGKGFSETLTRAKFEELNRDLFQKTLKTVESVLKDGKTDKDGVSDVVLVGGSTRIPKIQEMLSSYFSGKKINKDINPDEAVAQGAAIQGGVLTGKHGLNDVGLIDICPLTLGIEANGGMMVPIIKRHTVIPTVKSEIFSTTHDNQDRVEIKVFEGERSKAALNNVLGSFDLTGIPPARAGVPQVEVTFKIDANGMLEVSARDMASGRTESAKITNQENRLSTEDIERMLQDAEKHAAKDAEWRKRAEAKAKFESHINDIRRLGDDLAQKLGKEDIKSLAKAADDAATWLRSSKTEELDAFEEEHEELTAFVSSITSKLYAKSGKKNKHDEL